MLKGTNVTTSYTTGTTINMDAVCTKMFLENIAITTIVQCREMVDTVTEYKCLKSTTNLPHYDDLIEKYCPGVHGAVLENMVRQNVEIIYAFIQDCVLNNTTRGLYLLYDAPKNGEPMWKLLLLALDEYEELRKREYNLLGRNIPRNVTKYNEYNKEFEKLMTK